MAKKNRLGRSWRDAGLGFDEATRRRGHVPEHVNPLFNYIAGTVLPAGFRREEPKHVRRRRLVIWVFGLMVVVWVVFSFVESPV